jgi:hypothetical protein
MSARRQKKPPQCAKFRELVHTILLFNSNLHRFYRNYVNDGASSAVSRAKFNFRHGKIDGVP